MVLVERRPRPFVRARAFERAQVVAPFGPALSRERRRPEPVRADHLRRHALRQHLGQQRVVVRAQRRVRVQVDEARAEPQALGVDDLAGQLAADGGDLPVRDRRRRRFAAARRPDRPSRRGSPPSDDRREPAVDDEEVAVDEVRGGRGEEDDGAAELVRLAPACRGVRARSHASNSGSFWSATFRSVRKYPGAIPFAWIPYGAHSAHIDRVSIFSPPFAAA